MTTSLLERVYEALGSWGEHPVYIDHGLGKIRFISAPEVGEEIAETSRALERWGIRQGQIVFLFLNNTADVPILFFALHRLGAIPAPLSLDYRSLELDEIFSNAQPQAVICEKEHLSTIAQYLGGKAVIEKRSGRLNLIQEPKRNQNPSGLDPDIAAILYTYRGYGFPLGALISDHQLLHGAEVLQEGLQGAAGERMLVMLPPHHIFTIVGCYLVPLCYKMTAVISETVNPRRIFQLIAEHRIANITAIPELFALFARLRHIGGRLPSLKAFVSGGSLMTVDTYENIRNAFDVQILHGYGLTELAPVSRNIRHLARPDTVGPICRGAECRIINPDKNGTGEIAIRSPFLFRGYYRQPMPTEEAFHDGWFLTGDIGRIEQGHLIFIREMKKTCKVNGKIVDLEEIRRALVCCPNVREAEVARLEGTIVAKVRPFTGIFDQSQALSIKSYLPNVMAAYKIPKRVVNY